MTFTNARNHSNIMVFLTIFWAFIIVSSIINIPSEGINMGFLIFLGVMSVECFVYLLKFLIGNNPWSIKNRYLCFKKQKQKEAITLNKKQYENIISEFIDNLADSKRHVSIKFASGFDFKFSDSKTNEELFSGSEGIITLYNTKYNFKSFSDFENSMLITEKLISNISKVGI